MKHSKVVLAIMVFVSMLGFSGAAWALSVAVNGDGASLVDTILSENSGLTVIEGSTTYTGAAVASGTFSDGMSSGIGIESGIIMTTGSAADAPGPNSVDNVTVDNGASGHSGLAALAGYPYTYNATVLEFDFSVDTDGTLSFNYIFASDEYNEWTNSQYNDVFAFFLDGENIALIPETDIPVAINTVNGGGAVYGNNPSYSQYYNNNDLNDGGGSYDIEYDGFTNVFAATEFIGEGQHHIELAITDVSDPLWDSAVFIEAGSFSFEEGVPVAPVPEPATMLLLGTGLAGLAGFGRKKLFKK